MDIFNIRLIFFQSYSLGGSSNAACRFEYLLSLMCTQQSSVSLSAEQLKGRRDVQVQRLRQLSIKRRLKKVRRISSCASVCLSVSASRDDSEKCAVSHPARLCVSRTLSLCVSVSVSASRDDLDKYTDYYSACLLYTSLCLSPSRDDSDKSISCVFSVIIRLIVKHRIWRLSKRV